MNLVGVISLGIGLSMDAFAISVTNGLCVRKLRKRYAFKMALCFGLAQAAMPLIGYTLGRGFSTLVGTIGPVLAFVALAIIGGKMIYESLKGPEDECITSFEADTRTLIVMAVATSIDALVAGVTLALTSATPGGIGIYSAISIIGTSTFVICLAGAFFGCLCGSRIKKGAEVFGGAILVLIGFKILFESL